MARRLNRIGPEAFEGERLQRAGAVAVAFLADWCPFCRAFEPEFASLATPHGRALAVADLTDLDSPLWDRFAIEVVPTVVVFRDGRTILRRDGVAGQGLGSADLRAIEQALQASARRGGAKSRAPSGLVR